MRKHNNYYSGFTLVELIVVIVIIAILATIVVIGTNTVSGQSRDAKRSTNATIIADALEKYYNQHGEYPSCQAVTSNASSVTGSNGALQGVDKNTLIMPNTPDSTDNAISCTDMVSVNVKGGDYVAYVGDGSSSCSTASCLSFTLKYINESTGEVKTIKSKHSADIQTSGSIVASTGAVTYITSIVNWTALPNATSYVLQRDTSNTFSTGNLNTRTVAANLLTYQYNDVGPSTTYYYRIKATSASGDSAWSNIVNRATTTLPAPTLSNAQNLPDSVTESWNSISGINSYSVQRSSNNTFVAPMVNNDVSTTSFTYTDTPIGTQQYYRVRANVTNGVGTTYNSPWSSTLAYTSFVPAPTTPTVSASIAGSTATGTSSVTTCTQTGTPNYSLQETHKANSGSADSWTAWTAWSSSVRTYSVSALQGYQHTFNARSACAYKGVYSTAVVGSASASSVMAINQPATPTWPADLSKSWQQNTYGHYMWFGTYCPAGTWTNQTWFHSWGWLGDPPQNLSHFYHTFGFEDYWWLGPGGGANVAYEARYTCATSYTESAWSPLSYDTIWVYW